MNRIERKQQREDRSDQWTFERMRKHMAELDRARKWLVRTNQNIEREISKATPGMQTCIREFIAAGGCTHQDWCDWMYDEYPSDQPVPARKGLRLVADKGKVFRNLPPEPDWQTLLNDPRFKALPVIDDDYEPTDAA
jgi:hypothetical protein